MVCLLPFLKIMKQYTEKDLWKEFSLFIRLRDADDQGYCKCFTCHRIYHFRKMDCGHGIGRQHKATKYNEKNNASQCASCNSFNGGRQDIFKIEVDKKYGPGTWDMLELASRQPCKRTAFEIHHLTIHYKNLVKQLMYKAA